MKIEYRGKGYWNFQSPNWPNDGSFSIGDFGFWNGLRRYLKHKRLNYKPRPTSGEGGKE